jgi:GntR family transcriptional regulator
MSDILQVPLLAARASGPSLPALVADSLRQTIEQGKLRPGARLPSEPELASQLRVSRATVRHALSILELEGLLVRQHGLGTFVSHVPAALLKGGLAELKSTTDVIRSQGFEPGTVGMRVARQKVSQSIGDLFGPSADEEFLHISRTRTANGRPVIHCEDYVPGHLLPARLLPQQESASTWSLYEALAKARAQPALAHCTVTPIVADYAIAERLDLEPGHPLLLLKQLHYTPTGRPVLYCENWHNSTLIEFQIMRRA